MIQDPSDLLIVLAIIQPSNFSKGGKVKSWPRSFWLRVCIQTLTQATVFTANLETWWSCLLHKGTITRFEASLELQWHSEPMCRQISKFGLNKREPVNLRGCSKILMQRDRTLPPEKLKSLIEGPYTIYTHKYSNITHGDYIHEVTSSSVRILLWIRGIRCECTQNHCAQSSIQIKHTCIKINSLGFRRLAATSRIPGCERPLQFHRKRWWASWAWQGMCLDVQGLNMSYIPGCCSNMLADNETCWTECYVIRRGFQQLLCNIIGHNSVSRTINLSCSG